MVQYFKGDAQELQMYQAGSKPFDLVSSSLDQYFENAYSASDFLLMLYDSGRMPFSDRVPRDAFISFITRAIPMFPFTGTFESYIFILKAVFGEESEIQFTVPGPGQLEILIDAAAAISFDFIVTQYADGVYSEYTLETMDGVTLEFRGISGIDSEAKLNALLMELIPAGIFPSIELRVFDIFNFVADDGAGNLDSVVDNFGNQLVFFKLGE